LVLNAYHDAVEFSLPEPPAGRRWLQLLDTNQPDLDEPESFQFGHPYLVTGRSLLLFVLHPERGGGAILNAARTALLAGAMPPPIPEVP
jgi:isoamylase